ncbi:MAG: hypothetical protein KIT84_18455 [Labilithrix sp.]|nr:hypothetical protein [Labilithrix sp.]MCW5813016.1 hypothetical protein [Labilithrix sp.]
MLTRSNSARRITAAALISLLAQTVTVPAWSQQADDPVTLQARARFKEGVEAFDKGKYEEARLAFLQAYTLKKHPAVLLNLAQSSAKSNHPLEAAGYFKQFLKEATTATAQQKKDAAQGLEEVRKQLGRIEVVAPAGTEITVDDQKVGAAPVEPVDVEAGTHTVKGGAQTVTVTAVVGQKAKADLTPPSTPAPDTPAKPETTPPPEPPPAPKKAEASLTTPPDPMWPVWVGLGVGAAGLVNAVVFAALKGTAQSNADRTAQEIRTKAVEYGEPAQGACNNPRLPPEFGAACAKLRSSNDDVDADALVANISLVVMGIGFVGAGAYYLFGPKRASDDSKTSRLPTITPWAGWQSGGLTIGGSL